MTPALDRVCCGTETAEPPIEAHPEHVEDNDPNPSPHGAKCYAQGLGQLTHSQFGNVPRRNTPRASPSRASFEDGMGASAGRSTANFTSEQTNEVAVRALDVRYRVLFTKLGNVGIDLLLRERGFPLEFVREVLRPMEDYRVSVQPQPSFNWFGDEALDLRQSGRQPVVRRDSGAVAGPVEGQECSG